MDYLPPNEAYVEIITDCNRMKNKWKENKATKFSYLLYNIGS